ncbi:MAG: sulfatase [Planctomycetota bacterium]
MQNRRQFLSAALAGAGLAALTRTARAQDAAAGSKPNVLFIAIDDLNDWTGCLGGHPDTKTPHIDRLAARGVLFQNAFCAAPVCNPSRTALMTGVRPSTSGVYNNSQPWIPVLPDTVTLEQHFKANGYQVIGRGKIYHGGKEGQYLSPKGWHEYVPRGENPSPKKRPANGIPNTGHFDWGPVTAPDEEMDDYKVARWTEEQLQKKYDKPVFIACGFVKPHLPWFVPQKYFDMFDPEKIALPNVKEDDLDDVPEMGKQMAKPDGDHKSVIEHNQWRKAVQGYLATIAFVDYCVGIVLDALDKSPYAKNTIVVLWGDHGWHLGEKLHWRKFALWEEATHAPLLMVAPGVTKPDGRCPRTVSFMDIYPTLCDLCSLAKPDHLEGVGLMPLLKDPQAQWDRPALTTHGKDNHTVRSEKWRYIRYSDGSEELYDEVKDPMEWTNLAAKPEHADVKKALAAWLPKTNAENAPTAKKGKKGKGKDRKAEKNDDAALVPRPVHPFQVRGVGPPEPIRSWLA